MKQLRKNSAEATAAGHCHFRAIVNRLGIPGFVSGMAIYLAAQVGIRYRVLGGPSDRLRALKNSRSISLARPSPIPE